jgi:ribosomal protein L11 methyltransferase
MWVEMHVPVGDGVDAGELAGALVAAVPALAAGAEVRAAEIVFWVPAATAELVLGEARAAAARLGAGAGAVRLEAAVPEAEWREAWKRHFGVTRITPRIVIVPSWERYTAAAGEIVIGLDPGRAFGTGAHASTRLCLCELDTLASQRTVAQVLDCGTGSGILAITAARLWPGARCHAIDVDPDAIEVATENVARNDVASQVQCSTDAVDHLPGTYEIVIANIEREPLLRLRASLLRRLAPGGVLVLAGVVADEADALARAYTGDGTVRVCHVRTRAGDGFEWAAVVIERDGV